MLELLLSCLANGVVLMEEVPVSIWNVLQTDILSFLPPMKVAGAIQTDIKLSLFI